MKNKTNYNQVLQQVFESVGAMENKGAVAGYIPDLATVDPERFGVAFLSEEQASYGFGDWQTKFSIQSISKVLSLSLAYKLLGENIWKRVGVEPSGSAFNSLVQLETNNGIPRNPLINGGAMVICDMLVSHLNNPKADFLEYVRELGAHQEINFSESTAKSEELAGYRNKALCNFIKSFGNIENHPDEVLDFYFHMCSLEMTCQELTYTFRFLAFSEFKTAKGSRVLNLSQAKRLNA